MDRLIEDLARAESLPPLWRIMIGFFRDRGYGAVSYFSSGPAEPGSAAPALTPPIHHGFHPAAVEAYLGSNYEQIDIVPRLTMAHGRPLRWSEAWAGVDLNEDEQRYLTLMRAVEMGDGYSLPCYGPGGRNGYVGIGRMAPDARTDELSLREMQLSAQAAHLRILDFTVMQPSRGKPLSAREREILDWVARGKSNGVIADILNISAGTVDTYLRRIYEKLGVSDRTSAAVRGIGMGLIAA